VPKRGYRFVGELHAEWTGGEYRLRDARSRLRHALRPLARRVAIMRRGR